MHLMQLWSVERFTDINTVRYDYDITTDRYIPSGDGMASRRRCDS